jgi:lysophospholipase L1-like esterase
VTLRRLLFLLLFAPVVGCGDSPTGPSGPGPALTCPANVTTESLDGRPAAIEYAVPSAVGGSQPVTVSCAPASGSPFAVGSTTVTCSAQDSANRRTECSFMIRVTRPVLTSARFLAFGDSLTWGVTSPSPTLLLLGGGPDSYPGKLQSLLVARYQSQTPEVLNDGIGGETTVGGRQRLPASLDQHRPGALLLMEGTNDLLAGDAGANAALTGLEEMVRTAKARGVRVFLATVPPQRAGGARHRDRVAAMIPAFNDSIRQIAAREAVTLVDVYNALKDRLDLIGVDDLHPTDQGYDVIASTYFETIKTTLEERRIGAAW